MALLTPQSLEFEDKRGGSLVLRAFQKELDVMLWLGRLHMVSRHTSQAGRQDSLGLLPLPLALHET